MTATEHPPRRRLASAPAPRGRWPAEQPRCCSRSPRSRSIRRRSTRWGGSSTSRCSPPASTCSSGITGLPSLAHASYFAVAPTPRGIAKDSARSPSSPLPAAVRSPASRGHHGLADGAQPRDLLPDAHAAVGEIIFLLAESAHDVTGGSNGLFDPTVRDRARQRRAVAARAALLVRAAVFAIGYGVLWMIADPVRPRAAWHSRQRGTHAGARLLAAAVRVRGVLHRRGDRGLAGGCSPPISKESHPPTRRSEPRSWPSSRSSSAARDALGPCLGAAVVVLVRDQIGPCARRPRPAAARPRVRRRGVPAARRDRRHARPPAQEASDDRAARARRRHALLRRSARRRRRRPAPRRRSPPRADRPQRRRQEHAVQAHPRRCEPVSAAGCTSTASTSPACPSTSASGSASRRPSSTPACSRRSPLPTTCCSRCSGAPATRAASSAVPRARSAPRPTSC